MTVIDDQGGCADGTPAERALRRWLEGDDSAIAEWLDGGEDEPVARDPSRPRRRTDGHLARRRELAERLSRRIVREILSVLAEVDRPIPLDDARWYP